MRLTCYQVDALTEILPNAPVYHIGESDPVSHSKALERQAHVKGDCANS